MSISFELYKVFCEVAKCEKISLAAEKMYMTQSAVTQAIHKLEMELNDKVFIRSKNGVELTDEGRILYEYVKDSVETLNNAENIFSQYTKLEKGTIRIAGNNTLIRSFIFDAIVEFNKMYPNVKVEIIQDKTSNLLNMLNNGSIDIVAMALPYDVSKYAKVETINIKEMQYGFVATKSYLKNNNIKTIDQAFDCKFIIPNENTNRRKVFNDMCKDMHILIDDAYQLSSTTLVKKFMLNDMGIAFVPIESLDDVMNDIKILKKSPTKMYFEGIACLGKNYRNSATEMFIKVLQDSVKKSKSINKEKIEA